MTPMKTQTPAVVKKDQEFPAWFREYQQTWMAGAAHLFVVSGDIYGNNTNGRSQTKWLADTLGSNNREIVLFYERARGFSFLLEETMRGKAIALLTGATPPASERDSMMSAVSGGNSEDDPFAGPMEVIDALRLIESLIRADNGSDPQQKAKGRLAILIEQADLLCPAVSDKGMMPAAERDILSLLFGWGRSSLISKTQNPIFLLCARIDELHPDLRSSNSGAKVLTIPAPTVDERESYIARYLADRRNKQKEIALLDGLTPRKIAVRSAGLNLRHLEDIFLLAALQGGLSETLLISRKTAIIESEFSEIAEAIEAIEGGFASLGGMPHFIEWAKADLIDLLQAGSPDAPKGILLVGPPGTGKTWLVGCLAGEVGFNALMLRMDRITSKYVGESERNLRAFFDLARRMAPVLIFIDELDQSDIASRGGGENPVARNLFGMMLQFMSDPALAGKVLVIAASNRPDKIDDALLRSGRFDATIPILLPTDEARASILRVQARLQGVTITDEAVEAGVVGSNNYNAGDLAAIVKKSKKLALRRNSSEINETEMIMAMGYLTPKTPTTAKFYTDLAVQACTDTEFLPPELAAKLANRKALAEEIKAERKNVDDTREERASW